MRISDWSSDVCSSDLDNRCLMAISCRRVSSEVMSIPLRWILEEWVIGEDRRVVERSETVVFHRWPLQAAWLQLRVAGAEPHQDKIGRASCRERGCQYV